MYEIGWLVRFQSHQVRQQVYNMINTIYAYALGRKHILKHKVDSMAATILKRRLQELTVEPKGYGENGKGKITYNELFISLYNIISSNVN